MRSKYFIVILLLSLVFIGCSKDKEEDPVPETNQLVNTSWTAPDEIAQFIYGGNCTKTVEFLTIESCQVISARVGGNSPETEVEQGSYTLDGNDVEWTIENHTYNGVISGSTIVTTMSTTSGGFVTYIKN